MKAARGGEGDRKEVVERRVNLGGKNTAAMQAGERIVVMTPGGGGWGVVGGERKVVGMVDPERGWRKGSLASRIETQETI